MENKKKVMIVVSILLVYFIIMIVLFGLDQLKNKFQKLEILMAPDTYLKYENGHWKDVIETRDLLGHSYHVYDNHKFLYDGILQYTNDRWYAFDTQNQPLSLPDHFFAYRGNMKVEIAQNYQVIDMSDDEIIEAKKFLKENKILFEPEFTKTQKISFDFNSDGIEEKIYIISNTLGMEEQKTYFSIAYLKTGEQLEPIILDISENMYDIPSLNLKEIIDYNNDQKYELIFEKIYFDQIGTCHEIFEYEGNTYQSIKECKIIERGDQD